MRQPSLYSSSTIDYSSQMQVCCIYYDCICVIGDAQAILVKHSASDRDITLWQISKQHDTNDADEQMRLSQLGLNENDIRHFGAPYCTRCIGDYRYIYRYSYIYSRIIDEKVDIVKSNDYRRQQPNPLLQHRMCKAVFESMNHFNFSFSHRRVYKRRLKNRKTHHNKPLTSYSSRK